MFKLADRKQVSWPVTVGVPQDGGKITQATFHADFEVLTQQEAQDIVAANGDLVERQLVGWKGVADDQNNEMEFSPENKAKLIGVPYVRKAIFDALTEINTGRAAARKN